LAAGFFLAALLTLAFLAIVFVLLDLLACGMEVSPQGCRHHGGWRGDCKYLLLDSFNRKPVPAARIFPTKVIWR